MSPEKDCLHIQLGELSEIVKTARVRAPLTQACSESQSFSLLNTQFIFLYDFMLRLELQPFILVGAFQFALCVVEGSLFCRYA